LYPVNPCLRQAGCQIFFHLFSLFYLRLLLIAFHSTFPEKPHHRTPIRECGLQEIGADKGGKPQPVRVYKISQEKTYENKQTRNTSQTFFYGHFYHLL
jgi:hypothetical protein